MQFLLLIPLIWVILGFSELKGRCNLDIRFYVLTEEIISSFFQLDCQVASMQNIQLNLNLSRMIMF